MDDDVISLRESCNYRDFMDGSPFEAAEREAEYARPTRRPPKRDTHDLPRMWAMGSMGSFNRQKFVEDADATLPVGSPKESKNLSLPHAPPPPRQPSAKRLRRRSSISRSVKDAEDSLSQFTRRARENSRVMHPSVAANARGPAPAASSTGNFPSQRNTSLKLSASIPHAHGAAESGTASIDIPASPLSALTYKPRARHNSVLPGAAQCAGAASESSLAVGASMPSTPAAPKRPAEYSASTHRRCTHPGVSCAVNRTAPVSKGVNGAAAAASGGESRTDVFVTVAISNMNRDRPFHSRLRERSLSIDRVRTAEPERANASSNNKSADKNKNQAPRWAPMPLPSRNTKVSPPRATGYTTATELGQPSPPASADPPPVKSNFPFPGTTPLSSTPASVPALPMVSVRSDTTTPTPTATGTHANPVMASAPAPSPTKFSRVHGTVSSRDASEITSPTAGGSDPQSSTVSHTTPSRTLKLLFPTGSSSPASLLALPTMHSAGATSSPLGGDGRDSKLSQSAGAAAAVPGRGRHPTPAGDSRLLPGECTTGVQSRFAESSCARAALDALCSQPSPTAAGAFGSPSLPADSKNGRLPHAPAGLHTRRSTNHPAGKSKRGSNSVETGCEADGGTTRHSHGAPPPKERDDAQRHGAMKGTSPHRDSNAPHQRGLDGTTVNALVMPPDHSLSPVPSPAAAQPLSRTSPAAAGRVVNSGNSTKADRGGSPSSTLRPGDYGDWFDIPRATVSHLNGGSGTSEAIASANGKRNSSDMPSVGTNTKTAGSGMHVIGSGTGGGLPSATCDRDEASDGVFSLRGSMYSCFDNV